MKKRLWPAPILRDVALYGSRVAGHDNDDEALAIRMFAELGDVPFYIARVEETPTIYEHVEPFHRYA